MAAIAFAVPLGLGLFPSLRLPSVVLEIVAGIVIGPQILGLVEVDLPLRVLALIGLAFLLFLAGLEIDLGGTHDSGQIVRRGRKRLCPSPLRGGMILPQTGANRRLCKGRKPSAPTAACGPSRSHR